MARDFEESDSDRIEFASGNYTVGNGDKLTLFAWGRLEDVSLFKNFRATEGYGSSGCAIRARGLANNFEMFINTDTGTKILTATSVGWTNNVYKCMLGFWDGDILKLYLDGVAVATGTSETGTLVTNPNVGISRTTTENWDGLLAESAIWNNQFSDEEILALAHGVNPFAIDHDNLEFYAPVYGNEDPEMDLTGKDTGTLTGTIPKTEPHPPVELLENYL